MGLLRRLFSTGRKAEDSPHTGPGLKPERRGDDLSAPLCEEGVDADELPLATGEFGRCPGNPIPVKANHGAKAYLDCLCALDGRTVVYRRIGSTPSERHGRILDVYAIAHPDGTDLGTLYLAPFNRRNSSRCPAGLRLPICPTLR
jgi:hypothetical protein